jgi:hypothetical protein
MRLVYGVTYQNEFHKTKSDGNIKRSRPSLSLKVATVNDKLTEECFPLSLFKSNQARLFVCANAFQVWLALVAEMMIGW